MSASDDPEMDDAIAHCRQRAESAEAMIAAVRIIVNDYTVGAGHRVNAPACMHEIRSLLSTPASTEPHPGADDELIFPQPEVRRIGPAKRGKTVERAPLVLEGEPHPDSVLLDRIAEKHAARIRGEFTVTNFAAWIGEVLERHYRTRAQGPASTEYRCGSCRDTGKWSTGAACPVCQPASTEGANRE